MRPLTATSLALAMSLAGTTLVAPVSSQAQIGFEVDVSVGVPPPPLPYYEQPPAPGYGYIWTPGYWAWSDYDDDYYWVPGTWVLPPRIGYLWTPPWWGWEGDAYVFNAGYWGPEVGFYGGINYGFGYTGFGYEGGYWRGNDFFYNQTVNNITNVNITNVYNRPVSTGGSFNRVSFNGPGGVQARPTPQQLYAAHAPRLAPTPMQQQHFQLARTQPDLRASVNHGAPPIAATIRPGLLRGPGVAPALRAGAPYNTRTGPYPAPGLADPKRYGQPQLAGKERFNGGYRRPGGYEGYRQASPSSGISPSRAPGPPDRQRYGQAPSVGQERFGSGYRGPSGYAGDAYGLAPPRRSSGAAPMGFNAAGRSPPYADYRAPGRVPTQAYGNSGYRAPASDYPHDGPNRYAPPPPRPYNGGSFRPPSHPPEGFGRGGFVAPPAGDGALASNVHAAAGANEPRTSADDARSAAGNLQSTAAA